MTATAAMPASSKKPQDVQKEDAMWLQKELINRNYMELATARANNRKVSATFVPGNLNELLMCFDFARSLPETNALQNGMRKKSGKFIMDAERDGQSEDVCTYVKADLGMMMGGEIGPTGDPLPKPDVLLLSYTGCFTFMKWFELIRHKYGCETVMLHVPYQGEGRIDPNMRNYVVKQLKETVIPTLERISGVKFDIDRLRQYMRESEKAENDLVRVLQSAKNRPSPIDGYFGAVYYIGPIFTAFRGTPEATEYYRVLKKEIEQRIAEGKGPITPEGELTEEKYRLVVEGPPQRDDAQVDEQQHQRRGHAPVPFPPGSPSGTPPERAGHQAHGRKQCAGNRNSARRDACQRMPPDKLRDAGNRNTAPASHAEPGGGHMNVHDADSFALQVIRRRNKQPGIDSSQNESRSEPPKNRSHRTRNLQESCWIGKSMHRDVL